MSSDRSRMCNELGKALPYTLEGRSDRSCRVQSKNQERKGKVKGVEESAIITRGGKLNGQETVIERRV